MRIEAFEEPLTGMMRLRDMKTRVRFSRVVAALAWPKGQHPGAVVAMAEDIQADPVDQVHLLRLVDYAEHADVERLLELAAGVAPLAGDRQGRSAVSAWVGNPWHPFAKRLRKFNDRLTAERRPRLNLRPAPGVGAWQLVADWAPYYDARTVGRTALLLGRRDLIAQVEDAGRDIRRPLDDFPAVAALFWAIAHCDERKVRSPQRVVRSGSADDVAGY